MIARRLYSYVNSYKRLASALERNPTTLIHSGSLQLRHSSSVNVAFQQDDTGLSRPLAEPSVTLSRNEDLKDVTFGSHRDTQAVVLRDYQEDAIQACLDALASGLTRIGVSSPTGSGKTTMFMHLIPKLTTPSNPSEERGKTLILVGSVELANQAEGAAKRLLGSDWSIEVEQAGRRASGYADVTIATYQTLNNIDRLKKFDPGLFRLVIVDEAHHAAALSYLRMLHYFNQDVELPEIMSPIEPADHGHRVPIVGFSATFSRPDQLALSAVFQKIVYHREIISMLDEGWLSPVKSTAVKCDLNLDTVELNNQGDFNTNSLASHLNTPEVNSLVVGTYLHRASDRRSTLVFCVDLNHVAALTQAFRDAGIDARSVSSLSQPHIRKDTIRGFSEGEFAVLINCEVLTEGTDIPQIDCIILARPTKSKNLLAQMVGRGLRLCPSTGKIDCYIIDIVDNVSRSNGMLVSPTLWGLSHDDLSPEQREKGEERDNEGEVDGSDRVGGVERDKSQMKVSYIDQDDPFRLAKKGDSPLAVISHNAWVFCGKNRYILELLDEGHILVAPPAIKASATAAWSITYHQKIPVYLRTISKYGRVKQVAQADTLDRALQTGDKFAERKMGREMYGKISRYATWRQRAPSAKALDLVLKMKGEATRDSKGRITEIDMLGRRLPISKITAAHVSAYLCAASHGGFTARKAVESATQAKENRKLVREEKARKLAERNLALPNP